MKFSYYNMKICYTHYENKARDNHNSPQTSTILIATVVITITTTTITTINTKTCIFVSLLLSGSMGSSDRTFDFDGGIDLSCYVIVIVECCGELWLHLVS